MPDQTSAVVQIDREVELRRCLYYLIELDKGKTKVQISEDMGMKNVRNLYYAIERWDRDGILEEARNLYLIPKAEEVQRAIDRVITEWPALLDRVVNIAKGAVGNANPRTQWEAIAWLHEQVVQPAMSKHIKAGATEASYAEKLEASFDPINISPTVTAFLKKADK